MSEQKEMPKYKCHKEVWALGIKSITYFMNGSAEFQPIEQGYGPIHLSIEYIQKHKPQPGGYYVIYEDGYESFSPAKAFEDGYTLIK